MSGGTLFTRRGFVKRAAVACAGAGLALLGGPVRPAQGEAPERVKVLVQSVTESTAADFARGEGHGLALTAQSGGAPLQGLAGAEFTSGVLTLPFPATHLGVHWQLQGDDVEAVRFAIRTSTSGQTWSDWSDLDVEATADVLEGRKVYAGLASAGRAWYAQYRATFQSSATVESVTVTALNSVDGPREALPAGTPTTRTFTTPDGKTVTVTTREGWGCDESLRFAGDTELWPELYVPVKKVVIHHTDGSDGANDYTEAQAAAQVRAVYSYHAYTLGWGDIGYNALVDQYGNIYEGRHGRGEDPATREVLSADVVAGHTLSHNYGSVGISALGNFQDDTPPAALLTALDDVTTLECGRHGIDPLGSSDFLQSNALWHDGMNNISGHYESNATSCPGQYLIAYLPALRSHVASRLGWGALTLSKSVPARDLVAGDSVTFTHSPEVTSFCLEGWYKDPQTEPITYLSGYSRPPANDPLFADSLAQLQVWQDVSTWPAGGTFTFPQPGHYTLHVRGDSGYEANLTFLVWKYGSYLPLVSR